MDSADIGDCRLTDLNLEQFGEYVMLHAPAEDPHGAMNYASQLVTDMGGSCTWKYAISSYKDEMAACKRRSAKVARAKAEHRRAKVARATLEAAKAERLKPTGAEERRKLFASKFDAMFRRK